MTVYEKGAEVVRLYNTLLGKEGFRKGGCARQRAPGMLCLWGGAADEVQAFWRQTLDTLLPSWSAF